MGGKAWTIREHRFWRQFGKGVRKIREQRGLTQRQVAARAKLNRCSMSQIERGEAGIPLHDLGRLAKALGCFVDSLLRDLRWPR